MINNLPKTDLYRSHQMNKDFDGGCFLIDISSMAPQNDQEIFELIAAACILYKLQPISDSWRRLTYDDAITMLQWGFQNDLAYGGTRLGKKKTQKFCKLILDNIDPETSHCFTNHLDDPWKENGSRSWNAVTQNTFDLAVVLLDTKRLIFTYLISED